MEFGSALLDTKTDSETPNEDFDRVDESTDVGEDDIVLSEKSVELKEEGNERYEFYIDHQDCPRQ